MAKKFYWLKLHRDFFKRHDIRIIEEMENGKDYLLFYLKLLVESIDHEGYLRFSDTVPYNEKMLSVVTNTNVDIVRSALKVFESLNMVEVLKDETLYMTEVEKMIGSETEWAEKKRKQRELPKLTNGSVRINGELLKLPDGSTRYVDEKRYGGNGMYVVDRARGKCEICGSSNNVVIHHMNGYSNEPQDLICLCSKCHGKAHSGEIVLPLSSSCLSNVRQEKEIEKEIEKEKEYTESDKSDSSSVRTDYEAIKDMWNELDGLGNIKGIRSIGDGKRRDNLRARLKTYTVDDFRTAIENIKRSKFLQGGNKNGWYIKFDWFILPSNFPKVLEGNYNDSQNEPYRYTGD